MVVLALLLAPAGGASAGPGLARLDMVRSAAGLGPVARAPALAAAAAGHAAYLAAHVEPGPAAPSLHGQRPGTDGFTGEAPGARALAAGYPHGRVRENVSAGLGDAAAAVEGLMTAIYHRRAFLDPRVDEAGVGAAGAFHVFVLGRADLREACAGQRPEALYAPPRHCLDTPVRAEVMSALCSSLPADVRFEPPWPEACPDGRLLRAAFMERWCASPPAEARFRPPGRYRLTCGGRMEVDDGWWRRFCAEPPAAARYPHSGRYYQVCAGEARVHAEAWQRLCEELPAAARYPYSGRFLRICNPERRLHAEWLEGREERAWQEAPELLAWPPPGWEDAQPAFYDEQPDPLPDYRVAGNPVSVRINPQRAAGARLLDLRLLHLTAEGEALPMDPLRVLDAGSDPHAILAQGEHVLFPREHLGWGRRYVVEAEVLDGGAVDTRRWAFTTRDLGVPVIEVPPGQGEAAWPPGEFALFLPPDGPSPRPLAAFRYVAPSALRVEAEALDPSTVRMEIRGRSCAPVVLEPRGRPPVRLRAEGCAPQG